MIEEKKPDDKSQQEEKGKPQKKKKSCFSWRNCCISCLILLVIFIIGFLILMSMAGIWRIPGLYQLFYGEGPKPVREVEMIEVGDEYIQNLFSRAVHNKEKEMIITEGELSYFVDAFAKRGETPSLGEEVKPTEEEEKNVFNQEEGGYEFRGKEGQAAIEDEFIEIFIDLEDPPSALLVRAGLVDVGGENKIILKKLMLGKLPLPVFLVNLFAPQMIENFLMSTSVESFEIKKGQLKLIVDPYKLEEEMREDREK